MVIRPQTPSDQPMLAWYPERAFVLHLHMQLSMDWTFSQQTFKTHICKRLCPKNIISSAAQNLDWRTKDESL